MFRGFITLLLCVVLGASGQLMLKKGVSQIGVLSVPGILGKPLAVFLNPFVLGGFVAYAISSLLWLTLVSRYSLSLIYPMVSLGYVFVVAGSIVLYGDRPNIYTWSALALIVAGVSLLARSGVR